jgi:hypothetical protein
MEQDCSDTDTVCKLAVLNQVIQEWGRRECDQGHEYLKCRKMKTLIESYLNASKKMQEKLKTCKSILTGKDPMSESLKYKTCVKDIEQGYIKIVEKAFDNIKHD